MLGMFICFVLPGILVGLLLSQGSKKAAAGRTKKKHRVARPTPVKRAGGTPAAPVKGQLYVYDLKDDFTAGHAA